MKLKSQEKRKDVQLRVKVKENIATLLEQYVVYANTQLGHNFSDVKELSAEIFRAFVDGDRGFKAWLKGSQEDKPELFLKPQPTKKADLTFENGLGAK